MHTEGCHPSAIGTNTKPNQMTTFDYTEDPSLPPQRHAGAVGIGPNYPLGPSLGDKLNGVAEEIKGRILRRPDIVEHGRERKNGELIRKRHERDDAMDPFKTN